MSYQIEGVLIVKYDTQKVNDRFRKREFVLSKEERNGDQVFEQTIKFQLAQDRCDILDNFNIEDNIRITFNVRGNKWEKEGTTSYFTNLDAWKIEAMDSVQNHDSPVPEDEKMPWD
tara:strand:+ start:251 stop:598 length:348 start_codon:yes stop_codon:yes gene_type:complete